MDSNDTLGQLLLSALSMHHRTQQPNYEIVPLFTIFADEATVTRPSFTGV